MANAHILIVEPDREYSGRLARTIQDLGFDVEVVEDGLKARRCLDRRPPDLVLLDEEVKGLTPGDFLTDVQARDLDSFLIVVSRTPDLARGMDWITSGVFAYLAKPLDPGQLKRTILKGLENQEAYHEVVALAQELKEAGQALEKEKAALKEKNEELRFLYDLASRLSATLDPREIVRILSEAVAVLAEVRLVAALTAFSPEEGLRLYPDRPLCPEAGRQTTEDLRRELDVGGFFGAAAVAAPESEAPPLRRRPRHRLTLPLTAAGRQYGVLGLYTARPSRLDPDRWLLLESAALQSAQALFNAHQHEGALHLAAHDPLTGLFNRRAFNERLAQEFERFSRYGPDLSLILLDLDHFKSINDRFGHKAGDEVLKSVAGIIAGCVRKTDVAARYGGEEFAVILPDTDQDQAAALARRIAAGLYSARTGPGAAVTLPTLSQGVADVRSENVKDGDDLIRLADQAMYLAKEEGRATIRTASDLKTASRKGKAYACR
ncbi:MAG: diguanylate cyclase [Thermodesulfobacteriota bacterium]